MARNKYLEETFKPIVDPLNKINDKMTKSNELAQDVEEKDKNIFKQYKTSETDGSEFESESFSRTSHSVDEEEEEEGGGSKTDLEEDKGETDNLEPSESPTNISILSKEIGQKGPLSRKYILNLLHGAQKSSKYHVYGARLEKDGFRMGDSVLEIDDNDNITVKEQTFKGTAGLFELIFKASPKKYTKKDLNDFKNICIITNSHRKGYSNNTPIHRNRSEKYREVIAKLFSNIRGKRPKAKGKGMSMKSVYDTNIIYYNNVNKLVDRMRLIYESIQAGHNGLDNEMIALTEELKGRGYIA
jgi:hypothetical protein